MSMYLNLSFPAYLVVGQNHKRRKQIIEKLIIKYLDEYKEGSGHPDLFTVDPAPSIGIESVREIQKFLLLLPYQSQSKVVLINFAQKMTIEAQNALLKSLEEATDSSVVILSASDESQLLKTIISRCVRIFTGHNSDVSIHNNNDVFDILIMDPVARLELSAKIITEKEKWIDNQLICWRNLLMDKLFEKASKSKPDETRHFLQSLSNQQICQILKNILETKEMLAANTNPQLAIDNLLLSIPQISDGI